MDDKLIIEAEEEMMVVVEEEVNINNIPIIVPAVAPQQPDDDSTEDEDLELLEVDEDEQEEDVHPLCVGIVASNILSYLSFQELKVCRLVCHSWEEESRLPMSAKTKVVLNSEERLESYMEAFIGDRAFFDTVQIGPFMYIGSPLADRFFELYGTYLKHLILQKTQCSAAHLRNILFLWAPNLEELSLHGMTPGKSRFLDGVQVNVDGVEIRPTLTNLKALNLNLMLTQGEDLLRDFLYDLLLITPNLERISVPKNTYKGFLTCLISTLLDSPDLPLENLSDVDALFSFGDGQIEKLTTRGFPLESLNMQLMPNVTLDLLLPLLESLNTTLKSLRLYFYLTRFKELPTQVNLERLEKLTLDTYQGSLRFTSQLPQLKELTMTMKSMDEFEDAFPREDSSYNYWNCRSLRDFKTSVALVESCPQRLIVKIHRAFPNLTSITLQGLTDSSFRLLSESYPNLQELVAPFGTYTDVGVTGLPKERLKLLTLSINLHEPECIGNLCRQYLGNLANLRNLRKLHIQSHHVTDSTIFFGVLHCKELKELAIERSDVTDRGIDAIINNMDIHRLTIAQCTRVSGPQVDLVRLKMKNRCLRLDFDEKRFYE